MSNFSKLNYVFVSAPTMFVLLNKINSLSYEGYVIDSRVEFSITNGYYCVMVLKSHVN